jgi:hypothetical protein
MKREVGAVGVENPFNVLRRADVADNRRQILSHAAEEFCVQAACIHPDSQRHGSVSEIGGMRLGWPEKFMATDGLRGGRYAQH